MMYQFAIILLKLFPWLVRSGANIDQIKLILRYKLLMDNRKQVINNSSKEPNYTLFLQYLFYVIYGGMGALFIGKGNYAFTGLFFAYALLMFMLCMNLISDFSTVILDSRDNTIILPRPVSEATYLTARILHISTFILGFAISFSIIPFIVVIFKYNLIAAVVFFINVLLSSVFSIFFTHLLYLGLMKLVSGERLKDIINYFQIMVTIFFMGGYQFLTRAVAVIGNTNLSVEHWWMILLPPSWMAGSNELVISFDLTRYSAISLFLSIIIPFIGLWLIIKVLSPGFSHKLSELDQGDLQKTKDDKREINISKFLARIFTRSKTESMFFQIIWKIAGRDRKFKQMIYPMLGFLIMFSVMMFYTTGKYMSETDDKSFLIYLYFPAFYLFVIIVNIKYSDNYKAAWLYKSIPLVKPGEIISAMIKAISIKLFLPVYIISNGFLIYYKGFAFIFQITTALFFNLLFLVCIYTLSKVHLPFSSDNQNKKTDSNMLLSILFLPIGAAMAGIHYIFIYFNVNFILSSAVLLLVCWFAFKKMRNWSWGKIETFEV